MADDEPDFKTDPKTGKVYPIRGKRKKGRTAVAGVVAGGALMAAGTGATGGFGAGGLGTAAEGALSQAMRTAVTQGVKHAAKGRTAKALRSLKLRPAKSRKPGRGKPGRRLRNELRDRAEHAAECAVWSYGEVQQFFSTRPCRELTRRLIPVTDEHGNRIAVSVVWVRMPRTAGVTDLRQLVDTPGTGSVTALGAVGPRIGSGEFTGEAYTSRPKGRRLVISEAAMLGGTPDDEELETMEAATRVAVHMPRPKR
ncbi:hypothetical protein [Prauserella alba]|uniref:Uncharacterized protein n=1 Tax=Prauserella alba TaxID=176898 RepID=A0ABN1VKU0_9PSEU|nr:hypothetical protein [Prauserella alba]MCP2181838.1 hypothetical protein [Prauserella alba]